VLRVTPTDSTAEAAVAAGARSNESGRA
jgi:hypothetical protein